MSRMCHCEGFCQTVLFDLARMILAAEKKCNHAFHQRQSRIKAFVRIFSSKSRKLSAVCDLVFFRYGSDNL